MTQQAVGYEDADIRLESGRLRVRRWGAAEAPAVVCVPGLSANLCGFDRLAERLAGGTLQLVAIDLRGRGRSEVTGAGTYGWRNRARDVLGVADAVGAPSFAIIGQSSGAAIAMTCAQLEPSRVERLVLVDLAGSPEERAAQLTCPDTDTDHSDQTVPVLFAPLFLEGLHLALGLTATGAGGTTLPPTSATRSSEPTSATTWPTAAGRASSPVGEHPAPHAVPRVADRDKPDRALAAGMAAEVVPWNPPVRRSPCCARQDQRMSTLIWG